MFIIKCSIRKSNDDHFGQWTDSLADPGGRGRTPNGRGPMICLCPKRYFFSIIFSLAIIFKHNFNRNMVITPWFLLQPLTLSVIISTPLMSNPGTATVNHDHL